MTSIHRNALVRYSATQMYALVHDVEAYPRRFAWCEDARVLEDADDQRVARLAVRAGSLRTGFTTRNRLEPGRRIGLELVEGPFRSLSGAWTFTPLGDAGCKVALDLDFEMSGRLIGTALAVGFRSLADRLVDEFCRAARKVYG